MKPVKTIVRLKYGSQLYGTATPTSDTDYKSVHLPSGQALLLTRPENHLNNSTKKATGSTTAKNTADDVDDESFALHKFFQMVENGDMMAIEALFAPLSWLDEATSEWGRIYAHRHEFLNRQCRGFVGYCQRQAAKYGVKGERLKAVDAIVWKLNELMQVHGATTKLGAFEDYWRRWAEVHDFTEIVNLPTPVGKDLFHLEVVDRKIPFTNTLKQAHEVFKAVLDGYGHRAHAAATSDGVDWKAVSHALRVGEQAVELLGTGHLTLPRPNAAELLKVKLGQIPYDEIAPRLDALLKEVEALSAKSVLPEKSNTELMRELQLEFYYKQVAL